MQTLSSLPVSSLLIPARAGGGHGFGGGGGGRGGGFSGGGGHFFFFGGGGGGGGGLGVVIVIIVLVVIVMLVVRRSRGRRGGDGGAPPSGPPGPPFFTPAGGASPPAGGTQTGAGAGAAAPGTWSHDDRPAIESVRGDLFPGSDGAVTTVGANPVGAGLDAITERDPAFDRDAFLEQAQRAFFVVQEAWTERKPEMSRQVMADGLWQQHRVQINGYLSAHKRNVLEDLAVGDLSIVTAHTDASYDTIVVRVHAACADYDVNDNGKVIRGNHRVGEWAEDWTFQRSSRATTQAGGGTLSQKCPNCGAPLNVDLAGVCPFCKAPVMSGDYDWVLARISQLAGS